MRRFLFSSSACVYPRYRQESPDVTPLREEDAWPADPEPGYGLEKLFAEELCRYYRQDYGLETRIVRFHNVYGPLGTYEGGKEMAPAAICRKVALARDGDEIEVWGDGRQTRSFMYVDDCVEGIWRLMRSDYPEPLNLGTDRLVTVDELVDIVCRIAGKRLRKCHVRASRRGCVAATATTRGYGRCWGGNPRSRWKRGWRGPTAGSRESCAGRGASLKSRRWLHPKRTRLQPCGVRPPLAPELHAAAGCVMESCGGL